MALNHLKARHFNARHFLGVVGGSVSPPVELPIVVTSYGKIWNNAHYVPDEKPLKIKTLPIVGMSSFDGVLLVKKLLSTTFNGDAALSVQIIKKTAIISEIAGSVDFSGKLMLNDLGRLTESELSAVLHLIRRRK